MKTTKMRSISYYHNIAWKVWNEHNPDNKIESGSGEHIHHKDKDITNNHISNLQKMTSREHNAHHKTGNKYWVGRKHTEETKRKIGEAEIGNTKALGYKHTEKAKKKISKLKMGNKNCIGRKLSKESKKKMSDSIKKWWKEREAT